MSKGKLTPRQKAFAREFLKDFNGTQAAIRAKFSKHTAAEQAVRLLRNVNVQAEIARIGKLADKEAEVVASVARRKEVCTDIINGTDARKYLQGGKDGSWVNFGPEHEHGYGVAGLKSRTDDQGTVITEIKLRDPMKAIHELNLMEGVHAPTKGEMDLNVTGELTLQERIAQRATEFVDAAKKKAKGKADD